MDLADVPSLMENIICFGYISSHLYSQLSFPSSIKNAHLVMIISIICNSWHMEIFDDCDFNLFNPLWTKKNGHHKSKKTLS